MMRKLLTACVGLVAVAAVAFFVFLPSWVDHSRNRRVTSEQMLISEATRALHKRLSIVDLHADPLLWQRDLLVRADHGHVDVPRLLEGNVTLQVFGVVTKTPPGLNYASNRGDRDQLTVLVIASRWPRRTWNDLLQRALYQSEKLGRFASQAPGRLMIVRSVAELDELLARRGRDEPVVGGLLAMEGLQALWGNLARVDTLFDAGFRMMGLTHFFDNEVGGSSAGVRKGGLTKFGRQVVRRLEERGIVVDLAHASPRTVSDVLGMATRPVVVSHTGVQATCKGPRNLSDDQVRGIGANGGLIGIGFWDAAVCDLAPPSIARAIRHVADLIGVDHVGLGSDFDGSTFAAFDAAGLVQVTQALVDAGFHEDEIGKIMGGNALRLLRQELPQR